MACKPREYVLTTIHRAANTDEPDNLRSILEAMQQIAEARTEGPLSRSTRARKRRWRRPICWQWWTRTGIITSDPVSYLEMIALESEARLLLTDSGGVQKEAYFFGVPCVVAREETEWTELVEIGWNRIAGDRGPRAITRLQSRDGRRGSSGDGLRAKPMMPAKPAAASS